MGLPPELYTDDLRTTRESLYGSEERLRLLVEQVTEYAIFLLDATGHVSSWNLGAARIKGYTASEIIGQHFSKFYRPEDRWKCAEELEAAKRHGRVEDEGWRVRKDGSLFWANVVITRLLGRDGALIGFAKVTRDLTDRRRAEEVLRESEERFRLRISQLATLSEALANAASTAQVCRIVTESGIAVARADTCVLHLLDDARKSLEIAGHIGTNPEVIEKVRRITRSSGNPAFAIGIGESPEVWIESQAQYEAYFPALARMPIEGPRSVAFWCLPLIAEGRTIGMISVGYNRPREFSAGEREFSLIFARQCAQALARARRLEAERASAALAERLRASLSTTLRSIGDALIATDASGAITLMNAVAQALTGWSEAEALGRPLSEVFRIVHEHTRSVVPSPVDRVFETGGVVGLSDHTVLLARDGREIPIDDSGAPIRSEQERIDGVVLVFRDVTDRKRQETHRAFLVDATTALAESLEYESTIARVVELAVPRIADWCVVELIEDGERTPRLLAVAHTDAFKAQLERQLSERQPDELDATTGLAKLLRTGRSELWPRISEELLVERCSVPEQRQIARGFGLVSAMSVPLHARSQVIGSMIFASAESGRTYGESDLLFAEDLAERCSNAIDNARAYRAEQRARRAADIANRSKDDFLAVVSHELRTPLNAIMGWAKMLTMQGMDETRLRRAHEIIERNSVAMAQLIEDLLDMSSMISGKLRIEAQPVDIVTVIEAAIESIRPAALAKSIELQPILETTLPSILGDPTRLQQVVWNLLSNAVKFTPRGGQVEICMYRVEASVEIAVTDNGQGIDPTFLPSVFDAFRQQDSGPTRHRGGLGLGLAITRQLVELHGGRIVARSDGAGRGATFRVTLPISAAKTRAEQSERQGRQVPPDTAYDKPEHIRGLRVLVVDDEADARRLVAEILEDCGCRVETASSASEAMSKFLEAPPEVLLSDIGMPGESGFELIRKVRALPREGGGDVPAAALTAYARPEDRRELLNAGYSIHLPKPIEPAELVAVVATLSRFVRRT